MRVMQTTPTNDLKTAEAIRFTIPPSVLDLAGEFIGRDH
jgi:hypothetical protein